MYLLFICRVNTASASATVDSDSIPNQTIPKTQQIRKLLDTVKGTEWEIAEKITCCAVGKSTEG